MISFTDAHQANDLFYMSSIKSDLDDSNGSNGSNQSPQNSRTSDQQQQQQQRTLVSPPHQNDSELIIKSKQAEQNEQHILSEGPHQGQFILTLDNIKPELKDTETITVTIPPADNGSPNIPYTIGKNLLNVTVFSNVLFA